MGTTREEFIHEISRTTMIGRKLFNRPALTLRRHAWRFHPKRWQSLDTIPVKNPVFLLGTQGGGLTLLMRMLRRHPHTVSVTGNRTYWAGPDEMQNVMEDILPADLTGLNTKIPPHPDYPHRNWLYATDDLLPLYRKTAVSATPQIRKQFLKAIRLALVMHTRNLDSARFIDKSQSFTVRLSFVNALLAEHNPYFLIVTRNPYAICYRSAIRVRSLLALNLPLEKRLELAAQQWANSFRCALEDTPQLKHVHIVSFETLLQKPNVTLQQICSFLDLTFMPDMLPAKSHTFPLGATGSYRGDGKWYPLRPDVNKRYLEKLEPWMIDIIHSYAGNLAQKWHYSPEGP